MTAIPAFDESHLKAICDVLGNTRNGLTNSEIDDLLRQTNIEGPKREASVSVAGGESKRERLFRLLRSRQERDRSGNNVAGFIKASLAPVRYVATPQRFPEFRDRINRVLAFAGYHVGEDGELRAEAPVRTIAEAADRAGHLRSELDRRGVHSDVLRFCRAELVEENYFHAVLEAAKSVADRIRKKTGLTADGSRLVDQAFGYGRGTYPLLAFNSLRTPTEQSEHEGLNNLMKGLFGAFRNVTAHAPKVYWPIGEQDALDLLTLASLIHRRLDTAVPTSQRPAGA